MGIEPIDITQRRYLFACIYGNAGTGKTQLAAYAPKPAFLDYENSTDVITALIEKKELNWEGQVFKPDNMDETWKVARKIVAEKKYETLVIDTSTRLQIGQMRNYIAEHPSVTGIDKITGIQRKVIRDKYTYHQGDYGYSANVIDDFLFWLTKQPINVIILAHAREHYKVTEEFGVQSKTLIRVAPMLTPKAEEGLETLFSLVGYLTAKPKPGSSEKDRRIRVNPTNIIVAKNRFALKEDEILNPTYEKLFGKAKP